MRVAILPILLLACIVGCDDRRVTSPTSLPAPTFGSAKVKGVVKFVGEPPERKMIQVADKCYEGATAIQEETIVVSPAGGLRDVIVYLKDAPPSDGTARPAVSLDQAGCRYVPHVTAVQVNQPLTIRSSDPVFHNVHWLSETNGNANLGFKASDGVVQRQRFSKPDFIRMRCDVHPWMEAFVGVMPSPFFAVTDRDGAFEIPEIPAGKYRLATWHPLLGEREVSIEVGDGKTAATQLEYARPTPRP